MEKVVVFKLRQLILKSSVLTLCPKITTKVRMPHGTNRRTMLTSKGALFHHCLVVGGLRWIENTYQLFTGDLTGDQWLKLVLEGARLEKNVLKLKSNLSFRFLIDIDR